MFVVYSKGSFYPMALTIGFYYLLKHFYPELVAEEAQVFVYVGGAAVVFGVLASLFKVVASIFFLPVWLWGIAALSYGLWLKKMETTAYITGGALTLVLSIAMYFLAKFRKANAKPEATEEDVQPAHP